MQPKSHRHLSISNSNTELSSVRAAVREFFQDIFTGAELMQVIQSTDEAVANVIEHGYLPGDKGKIDVDLYCFADHAAVVVTDDAREFDHTQLSAVDPEENFDKGIDGGIGVYIYSNLMEAIREKPEKPGNRLRLIKRIRQ